MGRCVASTSAGGSRGPGSGKAQSGVTPSRIYAAERAHLDGTWPDHPSEYFDWALGPIHNAVPGFGVRRIGPVRPTDPWVYVSSGAWTATASTGHGLEFMLQSPTESAVHVELLAMVTNFHADPAHRLEVGRTINVGRPWMPGSESDHLIVSLPYPYGPQFECCPAGDFHLRFLWLVPITAAEAQFVRQHGYEELEDRFEAAAIDTLDPNRASVV